MDQANIDTILPQLNIDDGTYSDIVNAVNAGKEAIVAQTDITFNGWTGCGYIITDPSTGAGAYMISGGMNGAWILGLALFAFAIFFFVLAIAAAVTGPAGILLALLAIHHGISAIFGGIAALVGKHKVDEFSLCLLEIAGVHAARDIAVHLGLLGSGLIKTLSLILVIGHGIKHFGDCMAGLVR